MNRISIEASSFIQPIDPNVSANNISEALSTVPKILSDSKLINDRIDKLKQVYESVEHQSVQRNSKLEEAHRFWKLMEDAEEEKHWMEEKMSQLSIPDEDVDYTSLSQEQKLRPKSIKIVEDEMNAHRNLQFERLLNDAKQLIDSKNYGHEDLQSRLNFLENLWTKLEQLIKEKQTKLTQLNETRQFFTDCEDVDSYLFDLNRVLDQSACDDQNLGKDEATVQNLLKKHKDLEDDFAGYRHTVQNVHDQAANLASLKALELGDDSAQSDQDKLLQDQVQQRLKSLDRRYSELADMFKLRKQKLNEQLSFIRIQNDAENVEEWIDEKESFLTTLDPTMVKDIEALEVIKHRFDGFEREMNSNAPKVAVVNQLARQLASSQVTASSQHLNSVDDQEDQSDVLSSNQVIQDKINKLNQKWSNLRKLVDRKRDDLNSTFGVQTFHIESQETISWIQDKVRVVQSTERLGNDLSGVMQMQRRLSGLERDMALISAKKKILESQADALEKDHPRESAEIRERLAEISDVWVQLKELLNKREESMGEAAELQKFLRELDHFSVWLTRTQTAVANCDAPQSLVEAEQMLNQHQTIKEEIDRYMPDYSKMKEFGDRVCRNADASDPQYLFLRERLNALDQGWTKLDQMWRHRQLALSEDLNLEIFRRDAKQAEQLLANQEYYLRTIQQPKSLEEAEMLLRKHQDFVTSSRANKDKIDGVNQSAKSLSEDEHRDTLAILDKAGDIKKRFADNEKRSMEVLTSLRDSVRYYQFLQDCVEIKEWIDYKQIQVQDESYR